MAVPARRRDRLEHLVRYVLRPPLALAGSTESSGGQLLYEFRRAWRDGSTVLLLQPLELLERLAAHRRLSRRRPPTVQPSGGRPG
jgi:Putative transposase